MLAGLKKKYDRCWPDYMLIGLLGLGRAYSVSTADVCIINGSRPWIASVYPLSQILSANKGNDYKQISLI